MREKAKELAELLKVLANENRLLILCALIESPLTVGEICEKVNVISQSAISQHLSILKAHGILDFNKSGQSITYFIQDTRVISVMNILKDKYCE